MELFAIKDLKSNCFGRPSLEANKSVALRSCQSLVNDPSATLVSTYPTDFELYKIGDYNEKNGEIVSKVEFIENLGNLKKEAK